jgi:hypothetical protein
MKIAAIPTVPKGLCPAKPYFPQSTIMHVIHIAKQFAQLRASVFHTGIVPQAIGNRDVIIALAAFLRAFLQVCCPHYF